LVEIIKKYFSKLPSGTPSESVFPAASLPEEKQMLIEKDTKQYFISAAYPLPKLTPKNFTFNHLVENLLGKGVNSRLWALRAKEELAYNVNSRATQMRGGGILEAFLETDKEKMDIAISSLRKVLDSLFESGISEEELDTTKINFKGYFLRGNETKETRARNLAYFEALGLGYQFYHDFFKEINSVTLEEINTHIKDIMNPEKRVEVMIGPKEEI
jgi:predicted Zn-dependent peptidase